MSDENKVFDLAAFIDAKDVISDKSGTIRLNKRGQLEVLNMVISGETNRAICKKFEFTPLQFHQLLSDNSEFKQAVEFMRDEGSEYLADMLLEIPKNMPHSEAKILSDNIRWLLSKRAKSKYGDSMNLNVEGSISIKGALSEARQRAQSVIDAEVSDVEDIED